ncbi:MAG: photosystem I core protein PsaB, partial [Leptolyngbyaceae cyanobacterium RM2_2_4]|nr:photosystem I core protein PsaB [Leptolyngbyaceae cyanobacterium RM2_2_4]
FQLLCTAIGGLVMAGLMLFAGWFHYHKRAPKLEWFQNVESMLNHHLAGLLGLGSLAWAGHQIHVAIPINKAMDAIMAGQPITYNGKVLETIADIPLPHQFAFSWQNMAEFIPSFSKQLYPFFTLQWGEYSDFLTFNGGLNPQTGALWLTDQAHHHLALAVMFIVAGHMYRTNWGIGHSIKEILEAHKGPFTGEGHKGLYETLTTSWHAQLAINLAMVGSISIIVAQHMYAMNPYPYMGIDYATQVSLFTHHMWLGGFFVVGGAAHGAIFMVRDYDPAQNKGNVLDRVLEHKEAIISHLSWVSLFLGFHTLGIYVHNDVMQAFATPEKQILIEPVFAQFIQASHGKVLYGFDTLLSNPDSLATTAWPNHGNVWLPGWLDAINSGTNSLFLTIGPGDFLVHHAIALGLHTTTLILVKGALDARGSKLMPDKKDFGYSFPCDGPGRGGTCDISAWDSFYLAMFWMLNTIGWVTFYWHWKHLAVWQGNVAQFNDTSVTIMGWLRDYLWLNSAQLINGYNPYGMNNLAVWAWMFLFGHLVWATGFMFLISWRGYWQELIETLVWAHERTPLANLVRWKDKPVAMSIVQGRLIGLAHFTVGYVLTYAAFLIASTASRFG